MKYTLERDDYLTMPEVRKLRKCCIAWAGTTDPHKKQTGVRVWICVDLALSTGLRVAELASLKIEDLDWEGRVIKVQRRKKGRNVAKLQKALAEAKGLTSLPGTHPEIAAKLQADIATLEAKIVQAKKMQAKSLKKANIPLRGPLVMHLREYLDGRTSGLLVLGQRGPLTRRGWQQAWACACRTAGIRPLSIHKARHTYATIMWNKTKDARMVQELLGHANLQTAQVYTHVSFEDMSRATEKMFDDE